MGPRHFAGASRPPAPKFALAARRPPRRWRPRSPPSWRSPGNAEEEGGEVARGGFPLSPREPGAAPGDRAAVGLPSVHREGWAVGERRPGELDADYLEVRAAVCLPLGHREGWAVGVRRHAVLDTLAFTAHFRCCCCTRPLSRTGGRLRAEVRLGQSMALIRRAGLPARRFAQFVSTPCRGYIVTDSLRVDAHLDD